MADPAADFRYTIGDKTIEGYQITEASRYQDKLWPDWLDSNQFMMVDGAQWITINGEEQPIPDLAWVVKHPDGLMSLVDCMDFENYVKVVPNVVHLEQIAPGLSVVPTITTVSDDELLVEVKVAFQLMQSSEHEQP